MTEAQTELARRFVELPGWEWRPGMLFIDPFDNAFRVVSLWAHGNEQDARVAPVVEHGEEMAIVNMYGGYVPDLSDAATIGAILGLVREAWGDDAHVRSTLDMCGTVVYAVWRRVVDAYANFRWCEMEAGALFAALAAAPARGEGEG